MKKITITQISDIKSQSSWVSKMESVILVDSDKDIDRLFDLLCEQDDYWKSYKDLIQVAPKTINNISELELMCDYCGKTDIYDEDWDRIQSIVPFFVFQYREDY